MSLRIAASLLTVLFCISAHAADDGSPAAIDIIVGQPTGSVAPSFVASPQTWISGLPLFDHSNASYLSNAIDSLFGHQEREFPFSPRLIRQSNYDTGILLKSADFSSFVIDAGMLPNGNDDTLSSRRMFFLQGVGADWQGGDSVLIQCDGSAGCLRLVSADEQPIDVLMAESGECCGEATACAADDCGEPSTVRNDAPARPMPPGVLRLHRLPGGTRIWTPGSRTDGLYILSAEVPTLGEAGQPIAEAGQLIECETDCEEHVAAHVPEPPPGLPIAAIDATNATIIGDSCSHAEPPLKAKVEHLLEAARHLAGAGYEDEAKLFRVEAEAIQSASTRLLTEKRQELERLQQEIAELEALTGQYQMIQIRCRVMELSLPSDCEAGEDVAAFQQPGIHVLTGQPCSSISAPSRLLSGDELAHALEAMQAHPCGELKTLAEPVILTMNGRPASLHNGGEFPILVPADSGGSKSQARVSWRNFGVMMQAVPFVQGDGKVRLNLETEVSDRDFENSAAVGGIVVPGLTTRRFHSDIETHFGETVAIAMNSTPAGGGSKCLLVLVTAQQVEPQADQPERD
ncbi:MAG: hypothetical protein U0992_11630 [Planctomycetaceae bacterium]